MSQPNITRVASRKSILSRPKGTLVECQQPKSRLSKPLLFNRVHWSLCLCLCLCLYPCLCLCQIWPVLGVPKMALWVPKSKFFSIQTSPQNPPKRHLRNPHRPSKNYFWPNFFKKKCLVFCLITLKELGVYFLD